MRRIVFVVVLAWVAVAAFAGGKPEAPAIGAGDEDVTYISPAASPGTQDVLSIPMSVGAIGGNNVVVAYQLEIRDANDNVVWVESAVDETKAPGFFGWLMQSLGLQKRETTVSIPERAEWDGTYSGSSLGADGAPVPEGEYTYVLTVTDSRQVTGSSEPRKVVVDNTPPTATASVDHTVFSPNGDGRQDTVTLTQQTSSEDAWVGTITSNGTSIFEVSWAGQADQTFTWNGRNLADTSVPDGEYTYTLASTDRAGNTGAIDPITVTVDTAPRPLEIAASSPAFSPNGDGSKDTVTLTFGRPSMDLLDSAVISVTDASGAAVGSVEVGDQIAQGVTLTGYLDQARTKRAPEGTYEVSVTATYGNGTVSTAGPIPISVDVTPPSGTVSISDSVFSPDGDGNKDTTTISENLSHDADWTGYVYVAGGAVLQTLKLGMDPPATVVWDGTDLAGRPVADGTYSYSLIGTDAAGNQFETNQVRVSIDRRPTTVELALSREYFSPNGDGEGDTVTITPKLSVPTGIESFAYQVTDSNGDAVLRGSGTGDIPASIIWDGRGPNGQILPEGGYVGVLDLVYQKGNRVQALTPVVTIDNTIPKVALQASSTRISPNGDGVDDTITFIPFVDPANQIVKFTGQVAGMDGRVVAQITGVTPRGSAVWDGKTSSGNVVPDGSYIATLIVEDRNGTTRRAQSATIALGTGTGGAQSVLRLTPQLFSPDGDGIDDTVHVTVAIADQTPIASWSVSVIDPSGKVFYEYAGNGDPVRSFDWDGMNDAGERVQMATDYTVEYEATDAVGKTTSGSATLSVDVLTVDRYGMRKIDLPDILFEGYTTRYLGWDSDISSQNSRVLDQIAAAMKKFPDYKVELDGHAVSVLYYDAARSEMEQGETLLPLSKARVDTILDAMAQRGIDRGRFTLTWYGKLRPLVEFSNIDGRYVDRRVEFYLMK